MLYHIPVTEFEEMIGLGLWVGHRFHSKGETFILRSIGQATATNLGERVVPVEIVPEEQWGPCKRNWPF